MTYANSDTVKTLTNEQKPKNPNSSTIKYDTILIQALDHAETKIDSELFKNHVPIPTIPESIPKKDPLNNLVKAANLYAAAFMFDTYYSSNDNITPTSRSYKTDASDFLQGYIEIIREGYNEETGETRLPPVGSIVR